MVELTEVLRRILVGVMLCHGVCMLACLARAALGPRFTDRVVAVNLMGTVAVLLICVLSYVLGESYLVDVAILYALLNLVAVVVLCRIARVHHSGRDRKREEGERP